MVIVRNALLLSLSDLISTIWQMFDLINNPAEVMVKQVVGLNKIVGLFSSKWETASETLWSNLKIFNSCSFINLLQIISCFGKSIFLWSEYVSAHLLSQYQSYHFGSVLSYVDKKHKKNNYFGKWSEPAW